jgi:hypothetical protein
MSTDASARRTFTFWRGTALIIIVAGSIWLAVLVNGTRRQARAARAIRDYGGSVHYDFEVVNGELVPGREPWVPRWLRDRLGDDFFARVTQVNLQFGEVDGKLGRTQRKDLGFVAALRELPGVTWLLLHEAQVTDDSLAAIESLGALEELHLVHASELTDAGLAYLAKLKNLKILFVDAPGNTNLTNAGLENLARLDRLRELHLWLAPGAITDAGLAHIAACTGLEQLTVFDGRFTDTGLNHLGSMVNLKELHLPFSESSFTERGMARLKGLTNLVVVDLQQ